jgi:TonB family protein
MPVLTKFIQADYPAALVRQGVAGTVILDLVVNETGTVDSVAVVKGIHPSLDSAAAIAAKQFVFSPAMADTLPVAVLMQYAYYFTIDNVAEKIERFVNLTGRLYERGTRSPLANATVAVSVPDSVADTSLTVPLDAHLKKIGGFPGQSLESSRTLIATSDSAGFFQFQSLPSCHAAVRVIVPNFENFADTVQIAHGKITDVVYRLERISLGDNEIIVYGKAEKKEVAQRTLTLNEVRKIPGLGGDAVKVVQAMPGVARTGFNLGALVIRGSGGSDSRYFLDGVLLPNLFHFGGLKSTYNSDALSTIDLYPGGFGARYGGALGGIIEITGRKPKTDRIHGYLDANMLDASFLVEGPVNDKISFLVSARRSYIANMLNLVLDLMGETLPFNVVPYYWDYIARTDVDVSKSQHLYLTLFGSKDAMDLVSNDVRGGTSEVNAEKNRMRMIQYFHMGILGWDWEISRQLKNELRFSADYQNAGVAVFGIVDVKGDGFEYYARDNIAWSPGRRLTVNTGLDLDLYPYQYRMSFPSANNEIVHDTTHGLYGPVGVYLSLDWKATGRLTLMPGVRFDYYPELIYKGSLVPELWDYQPFDNARGISGEPSARLTARYQLVPRHLIKGSVGTYNQTPQPMGQAIDKHWGTPTLPTEKGCQYVTGYEWQISDLVSADVQAYYNRQWDNARGANGKDLTSDPFTRFYSDGRARMGGLELLLRHDQGNRFFGWLAYSLSRSERWDNKSEKWVIYSKDETHYVQLIGNYRLTPTQEIGTRLRYVTGDPTTPILGTDYFDATYRSYVPRYGAINSDRMASYVSLDLRYEKKFVYRTWNISAYLDVTHVENLFNKGYRSPEFGDYTWNYDYTSKTVFSDITRPAFGMKVEF